jgi:CRISPR-associated protein Csb3
MTEAAFPVDLRNPGQVFACLGFIEAAQSLLGDIEGAFDWSDPANIRFALRTVASDNPVERVLRFFADAEVVAEAPHASPNLDAWTASWGVIEARTKGTSYAFPDPSSPATLLAVLRSGSELLSIDYWGDQTQRDNVKFWAGAGGYPGAALTRDALALIRKQCVASASDPFALAAAQSSSFRLDWRRDYIPIDAGFSLNEHSGNIETVGFPLVELLGALGLSYARPERVNKLEYRYGVIGRAAGSRSEWFPPSLLRAALGGAELPFASRHFRMHLGWPGKAGQARAITTVTEETRA